MFSNDLPASELTSRVTDALFETPTLGMRCVDAYTIANFDGELVLCENAGSKFFFLFISFFCY